VSVREIRNGKNVLTCNASEQADYQVGTDLPEILTLGWWTDGKCVTLPPGSYIVNSTWNIHGTGLLPNKAVTATSNIFEIH
jgi:hypothetical protein